MTNPQRPRSCRRQSMRRAAGALQLQVPVEVPRIRTSALGQDTPLSQLTLQLQHPRGIVLVRDHEAQPSVHLIQGRRAISDPIDPRDPRFPRISHDLLRQQPGHPLPPLRLINGHPSDMPRPIDPLQRTPTGRLQALDLSPNRSSYHRSTDQGVPIPIGPVQDLPREPLGQIAHLDRSQPETISQDRLLHLRVPAQQLRQRLVALNLHSPHTHTHRTPHFSRTKTWPQSPTSKARAAEALAEWAVSGWWCRRGAVSVANEVRQAITTRSWFPLVGVSLDLVLALALVLITSSGASAMSAEITGWLSAFFVVSTLMIWAPFVLISSSRGRAPGAVGKDPAAVLLTWWHGAPTLADRQAYIPRIYAGMIGLAVIFAISIVILTR